MSREVRALLTIDDVAAKFGISVHQARRLTRSGVLPAVKIAGQWRYHTRRLPRSIHHRNA